MNVAEGDVLGGKYRVEKVLGRGGMGVVVAAFHLQLSQRVARVIDVGSLENGVPYIVMEFLEGGDLSGHLASGGPLPVARAAELTIEACEGLAEAHSLGIVHRDLKP